MLNFNSILVFSENQAKLSDFYAKVLAKKPDWTEDNWSGWKLGSGFISVGSHDKVSGKNKNPERIIINLETDDVSGEFDRIKKLGVEVVKEPYRPDEAHVDMWIATFADPDGNFFQLMTPWKGEMS